MKDKLRHSIKKVLGFLQRRENPYDEQSDDDSSYTNARNATIAFQNEEYSKAISLFKKVPTEDLDAFHYAKWGKCHGELSKEASALKVFATGVKHFPDESYLINNYCKYLVSIDKYDETLVVLDAYEKHKSFSNVDSYSNFGEFHYYKAVCYILLNQNLKALNELALLESTGSQGYIDWVKKQEKNLGIV